MTKSSDGQQVGISGAGFSAAVSSVVPRILGIGGTTRGGSISERALRYALSCVQGQGAETELLAGTDLVLPLYSPISAGRSDKSTALIAALRRADGIILSSPGYHGCISGLLKNALDYVEDLRDDPQPYLEGRAVGLIACAIGTQACGTTLMTMRTVVHALRGWPTPLGVTIKSSAASPSGSSRIDAGVGNQLAVLALQVLGFARMREQIGGASSTV